MASTMDFLFLSHSNATIGGLIIISIILTYLLVLLYRQAYSTDIPYIPGLPEPSGAQPFYGHLKLLGDDHPSKFQEWSTQNRWPVIQAKFGTRRVVVLNTFQAAQEFIVKNATATIDRPIFWTFHKILSSTQGGTIGTAPWDSTTKRRRTAVQAYMTRPAIQKSGPMIDVECRAFIRDLFLGASKGATDVNPEVFFKRLALNLTMEICYGTRFESIEDPKLLRMLTVAETVSTFRSTNRNIQDYVPLLRYLPNSKRSVLAAQVRDERDRWLADLFASVQQAVRDGTAKPCIVESLLTESSKAELTLSDIQSINVSLVSGGFETVATTGLACLGLLATPEGQAIQDRAYKDLMSCHDSIQDVWETSIAEEKSPYVVALVREMLRYFAAIQFLPPRQTMKEFTWQGVRIPKGVTVIQNAQAINHCKDYYGADADIFRPERWLYNNGGNIKAPYHYSFGAGSRACPAIAFSNRVLYATFARLIVLLRVLPGSDGSLLDTNYVHYNSDTTLQTGKVRPYTIRLEMRDHSDTLMEKLFN